MDFAFTEEQEALRETARGFLAEHSSPERVRAAMTSERGFDPKTWKQIAELGWTAVNVPEPYDGLGLGSVEQSALLEVMGESLLCAPYFASTALGANALLVAGTEEQKRTWLPRIAAGEIVATLAFSGATGGIEPEDVAVRARLPDGGDGFVLDGEADFVVDGHTADLLVVAAHCESDEVLGLFAVPTDAAGLARRVHPTLDQTRRLAALSLRGVALPAAAAMRPDPDGLRLREILDRAAVALAAEQVGTAQRCLDLAVSYAKERVQFGRPIGSFQAIKHKCADMMVELESARSAAYYAACVAAEVPPGAYADGLAGELPGVASLARAACSDACIRCAADCLQIHGGVGFTWEYDAHLYFKRARSSEVLLGDPAWHRERIAREIGLDS
jgi:alkylation response protein AidB-like acyl-CoA dehydrogenase